MNTAADLDYARYDHIRPILWTGDALQLLDQRKLPFLVEHVACRDSDEVAAAIHALTVRGAPAIGIAAAWGVVLAARDVEAADGVHALQQDQDARRTDALGAAVGVEPFLQVGEFGGERLGQRRGVRLA